MELPQIGKQCSKVDCKQLDFLPFVCNACGLTFCAEHFREHSLECNTTPNVIADVNASGSEAVPCGVPGCNERLLTPIICERCNGRFCVRHRHGPQCAPNLEVIEQARHAAEVNNAQFTEAKARAEQEVNSNIAKTRKRGKNEATAAKVELMRLKARAKGDPRIPVSERVYFQILGPSLTFAALWFSCEWSVGRVVDVAADQLHIRNTNNMLNAPKLRLFKQNGEIISEDMAVRMSDLFERCYLRNGETLELRYLEIS